MKASTSALRCGISEGGDEARQGLPELADVFGGLGEVVGEVDFGFSQAAQFVDGELEAVLVLVDQALDLDEVVLIEGVDGILDVVPHLGFDVAAAIAEGQSQVGFTGLLGLDLLGNHHEARSDDLVFVLDAVGNEKFLHRLRPVTRSRVQIAGPSAETAAIPTLTPDKFPTLHHATA